MADGVAEPSWADRIRQTFDDRARARRLLDRRCNQDTDEGDARR